MLADLLKSLAKAPFFSYNTNFCNFSYTQIYIFHYIDFTPAPIPHLAVSLMQTEHNHKMILHYGNNRENLLYLWGGGIREILTAIR